MGTIEAGLSLMVEPDFLGATLPLFEAGVVRCVEWSVDLGWSARGIPEWLHDLLAEYEAKDALYAHGVHFSPFSAEWQPEKDGWLANMARERKARTYRTLSEHVGFSTVPGVRIGAPFPFPFCDAARELGVARLRKLHEVSGVPVALENLPLSFCEADVWAQGPFLRAVLGDTDGLLHLDVHNLHCQLENFGCDPVALLETYPLERVRTMHVSGGSWADARNAHHPRIRQDTHDEDVPEAVFQLLEQALRRAPNVEAVFLERLGGTTRSERDAEQLRVDYKRMAEVVAGGRSTRTSTTTATTTSTPTSTSTFDLGALASFQRSLIDVLLDGEDAAEAFRVSSPPQWRAITRAYEPRMLRLAARIANSYTLRNP